VTSREKIEASAKFWAGGMNKRQFFIFGYYGWKNVGDDALLYALLEELQTADPEAKFAILSPIPVTIPPQVENRTTLVKLSPLAVAGAILKSSAFVIGGGTHITDYGNKRRALKILSRIFALALYSKLLGKKVYLINNGVGPFSTSWGRLLSRMIFSLVDFISVRDKASYGILKSFGFTHKATLAFDLSALLEPLDKKGNSLIQDERGEKQILGISITPVFEIFFNDKKRDSLLIDEIAGGINEQLEKNHRLRVYLFIFKGRSRHDDVLITQSLQERLHPSDRVQLVAYNPNPVEMLTQVARCDAFVGMRYHACLFAYLGSAPLLAMDYHPKCGALADEIGLSPQAVLPLDDVLNGRFQERLGNLLCCPDNFRATMPVNMARQRARSGVKIRSGAGDGD
jgi:polysaccharide pyruvyl transferase CsaB